MWFTGLPAAGKTTLARATHTTLIAAGRSAYVLDGDELRQGVRSDLGYSRQDTAEQTRRVADIAAVLADEGLIALVAVASPHVRDRELARLIHEARRLPFFEIFVDTPRHTCETRDHERLYSRTAQATTSSARAQLLYQAPPLADLTIRPGPVEQSVSAVLALLTGS